MSRSIKVNIGGHTFSVRTDAKPQYLKELAGFVNDKITAARAGKAASSHTLAFLAALTIADEFHQLKEKHEKLEREVRRRSQTILRYLAEQEAKGTH